MPFNFPLLLAILLAACNDGCIRFMAPPRLLSLIAISALMLFVPASTAAQTNCDEGASLLARSQPQGVSVADIIQKMSAQESVFQETLYHYTYREEVLVQTLAGAKPDGEFRRISQIKYNEGKRIEYVEFAPQSTLRRVSMSKQDFDDIERSPFVLTLSNLSQYQVDYVGLQKVDMLDTYVFDVAPRQIQKDKRYFQGRVWVENQDFAVVKTCGKNVPEEDPQAKKKKRGPQAQNVEPTRVTYREQFEHRYWFPTYVRCDDTLHFQYADDVRVREVIKYTQFTRADTDSGSVTSAHHP